MSGSTNSHLLPSRVNSVYVNYLNSNNTSIILSKPNLKKIVNKIEFMLTNNEKKNCIIKLASIVFKQNENCKMFFNWFYNKPQWISRFLDLYYIQISNNILKNKNEGDAICVNYNVNDIKKIYVNRWLESIQNNLLRKNKNVLHIAFKLLVQEYSMNDLETMFCNYYNSLTDKFILVTKISTIKNVDKNAFSIMLTSHDSIKIKTDLLKQLNIYNIESTYSQSNLDNFYLIHGSLFYNNKAKCIKYTQYNFVYAFYYI